MSAPMGTRAVVVRRKDGWRWMAETDGEMFATGMERTRDAARAAAAAAINAWLAEAWRMIVPGAALTAEQKKLMARFAKHGDGHEKDGR